jgi:hypothetical protein
MSGLTKAEASTRCKATLQNAGTTLILLGSIDLVSAGWAWWHGLDYARDFGFAEIVVGIFLFRQGLKTAKYVRALVLAGLPMTPLYAVFVLMVMPLDYLMISLRLSTGDWIVSLLHSAFHFVVLFWLQNVLGKEEVAYMQVERRITPFSTAKPVWIGIVVSVIFTVLSFLGLHCSYASKAVAMAQHRLGPDYKCFAYGIHWDMGEKIVVGVIGYKADSIQELTARFKDSGDSE